MPRCRASRIRKNIEELAAFTQTPGQGCTRLSYTDEFKKAAFYIIEEMRSAGLTVREDAAGNIIGRYETSASSHEPDSPVLLTGSHFDSVLHGGNFDGPAGIFAALEAVRVMKETEFSPAIPIEIIAMPEEEGTRFGAGIFASRALCGQVTVSELKETKDSRQISQYEAMRSYGLNPDHIEDAARKPLALAAYLELHIEQGPILENSAASIGIVQSIVGLHCYQIEIHGRADHAGTTPLPLRADALLAAARAIIAAEEAAGRLTDGTVITFSSISSSPQASNIVQNQVCFTADCRSSHPKSILHVMNVLEESLADSKEKAPDISWTIRQTLDAAPALMDPSLIQCLSESARKLQLPSVFLNSGAGHDAMTFASVCPAAMIFVPSKNGRSHCPEEWTDYQQIADGADVLLHTLTVLSGR